MNRILIKCLLNAIVIVPALMFFSEATLWGSLLTGLVLSVIAYFVGDQWILRMSNNIVASVADAGMAFVYLWLVSNMMDWSLSWGELTIIALLVGIVEFIFHLYLGEGRTRARS